MKKEIKRIFGSKMLIATLVAVVILPLIYGGLYLWAFWDPYGKMENLPVAIVNEDKCAYKSDKNDKELYCFGNDLVNKLKEERVMNWQFVDKKEAENGLENKKYYTMALIPENFSENILSVDGDQAKKAEIEFKSRQASSFMAAKFTDTAFVKIKAALNEKISKEYFDNIFSESRDSVKDLQRAVDGANDLAKALNEAKDGGKDLYEGTDKLNSGIYDLRNGLNDLFDGSTKLNSGVNTAYSAMSQINSGANSLKNGLEALSIGSSQTISATDSLYSGQLMVINQLSAYLQAHPEASGSSELMTALGAAKQVGGGISQLKGALVAVYTGSDQLIVGADNLNNGLMTLEVGISDVATGSASLKNNLAKARDGSNELLLGVEKIKDGQNDLNDGLVEMATGSAELRDKLGEAVEKNSKKTEEKKNQNQAEVMAAPVDIHDISIDIVNNNGTGFAPYFIPLALWVGGMAVFFLVDINLEKRKVWRQFAPKFCLSVMIAVVQALTLDAVLMGVLSLKVRHFWIFILFTVLLAVMSTLIQLFLTLSLRLAGKFVGIVLLMLQLTSSAGSYPIETAPDFLGKIGSYLPMTYAVSGLREIISGDNFTIIGTDIKVILFFALGSMLAACLYLIKKYKMLSIEGIKKWQFLPIKKEK